MWARHPSHQPVTASPMGEPCDGKRYMGWQEKGRLDNIKDRLMLDYNSAPSTGKVISGRNTIHQITWKSQIHWSTRYFVFEEKRGKWNWMNREKRNQTGGIRGSGRNMQSFTLAYSSLRRETLWGFEFSTEGILISTSRYHSAGDQKQKKTTTTTIKTNNKQTTKQNKQTITKTKKKERRKKRKVEGAHIVIPAQSSRRQTTDSSACFKQLRQTTDCRPCSKQLKTEHGLLSLLEATEETIHIESFWISQTVLKSDQQVQPKHKLNSGILQQAGKVTLPDQTVGKS